ncbi:hypothetical protein V2J09_019578 [Rumex salicifolius]
MEKITSIRFSNGRRSSLAVGEELNVAEVEFLDLTDESSEGIKEDSECDEIPAEVKLIYAVHEGDLEEVEELLVSGAQVNYKDIDDRTAMHVAACQGYQEVVELLIHHGADIDAIDKWGSTPLADAIHYKNHCVITLLEKHGANPTKAQFIRNELKVPEYEIDPQEIDFTDISHNTKVTLATWRGIEVSVKKVDDISIDEERRAAFRDELALLQRVRHPNVVQFLGAVTQSNENMIVTEYFPKGDLCQYLKENGQLKPRTAIKLALDIARGIGYLHEHKPEAIIHGALEPLNIMWDVSGSLKVANFGICKLLTAAKVVKEDRSDDSVECQSGSRYMAPELFRNEDFDTKVDVFSFALILQEMIEGCPPFSEKDEAEVAEAYADKQRPPFKAPGKLYPHGLKELIEKCWNEDPAERPTFREIIVKLGKISHHIGHRKLWKVSINTISKNLSNGVLLFKFHHR